MTCDHKNTKQTMESIRGIRKRTASEPFYFTTNALSKRPDNKLNNNIYSGHSTCTHVYGIYFVTGNMKLCEYSSSIPSADLEWRTVGKIEFFEIRIPFTTSRRQWHCKQATVNEQPRRPSSVPGKNPLTAPLFSPFVPLSHSIHVSGSRSLVGAAARLGGPLPPTKPQRTLIDWCTEMHCISIAELDERCHGIVSAGDF